MASCPRVAGCPLFEQFSVKSSLKAWRAFYCDGDFGKCERWKLVAADRPVPLGLLPDGRHLDVPVEQLEAGHVS